MGRAARSAPGSPAEIKPIAVSMGDPAGIGPDITLAAWLARREHGLEPFAVIGDATAFSERAAALGLDVPIAAIGAFEEAPKAFKSGLPLLSLRCANPVVPGRPDADNARSVIGAIEAGVNAIKAREARALVTNPISKSVLMAAGFAHPGHTEFLGALAEREFGVARASPVMLLASDELKVVPLTVHIPLSDVPQAVTAQRIVEAARILHRSLVRDFGFTAPRIAVAGLNPHAGEDGRLGDEDARVIAPAIEELRQAGLDVTGPYPADTLFHAAARATYDAVLAMYHDQALIPIKTLAFDTGVNVTIGLPFVRTSPDHGTAFAIAGTGRARASSFIAALKVADEMARRREAAASESVSS